MMRVRLCLLLLVLLIGGRLLAQDNKDGLPVPTLVTIPGTLQSVLGCPGDWQPECEATALTYDAAADLWTGTFALPAGSYEYKVALNGSWTDNYGANGEKGGANIPLTLDAEAEVTFTYDHKTGIVTDSAGTGSGPAAPAEAGAAPAPVIPTMVNVPGTLQPALGCPGEWQPDCTATQLEYLAEYDVWTRTFAAVPAGSYEYKVAIDGGWGENYGGFGDRDGPNIPLSVPADVPITFVYDHKTNWIMDTVRQPLVTAPGTYQDELGCAADAMADCLLSWLQDVDGDGIYTLTTAALPAGEYEAQAAVNGAVLPGAAQTFTVAADGEAVTFAYDASLNAMVVTAGGSAVSGANLRELRAHWVNRDTLLWAVEPDETLSYRLLYSADASMAVDLFGLKGSFAALPLTPGTADAATLAKFPHLAGQTALKIDPADVAQVPEILRGQFAVAAYRGDNVVNLAGLQIPGVLDDLFTYEGDLGVVFDANGIPSVTLWAPTARNVSFLLYADSNPRTDPQLLPMVPNAATGTWRIVGLPSWQGQFYRFVVEVYAPSVQQIVQNEVTDPYSISLSVNSLRSQIVDLNEAALKPAGWDTLAKPELAAPEDIVLYELHIRDFSAFADDVPAELRGTYSAFTLPETAGMRHLAGLAAAGLTHVHLLPSFDIATINENRRRWFEPDYAELAALPPDSDQQQAILAEFRDLDGFNWGYDPYHFNVPEGSYSTNPDGPQRVLEYRQMVQALNLAGLRVVQDVVYNHTNAAGQEGRSVLDRVVPGYYHRLDDKGQVARSTCCANTATEHNMMRRLMIDSVLLNARFYKIDGFRFDLMGHHMLADMVAVRQALDTLTLETDGVDGRSIYVYGEGWNFGEVADNARGLNATQLNIGGTGIGVFNDRLRDAVRGGSPFGDRLVQGLSNGLYVLPNGLDERSESLERLLLSADLTRVGLAGNLRDYTFTGLDGTPVTGADVDYNGSPAGYTLDPQENILYVAAHDNETLYDIIAYKAPRDTTPEDRVRMNVLAMSYIMYAQGIPFFHAGDEMLRSKSLDRNSYNSGDWFNRLDFTFSSNNFGVGLPPRADNSAEYPTMQPLLADPALRMGPEAITATVSRFQDMLRVRASSPLFRLQTAQQVQERLSFYNVGPEQQPGVIVLLLDDRQGDDLDETYAAVAVVFNATPAAITWGDAAFADQAFELHPALAAGSDEVLKAAAFDAATGTFSVPAWSTAVFVLPQRGAMLR
ncbi:MAG: pullulanase-type alpha-1,6-glucosidase [Anaerolineae bacterium]|nr:pullulanase-type alpha-1,6-glucosidase [Anaerolineae bacterium]